MIICDGRLRYIYLLWITQYMCNHGDILPNCWHIIYHLITLYRYNINTEEGPCVPSIWKVLIFTRWKEQNLRWLIKAMREISFILFPQYNILFPQHTVLFPQERYFAPTTYYFAPKTYYFCSHNILSCSLNILLILINYPPQQRPPIIWGQISNVLI